MKQRIELTAEPREAGKHNNRALRRDKKIPAIVYGATEPTNVYLAENDVIKYNKMAFENALFTLKSSNGKANGKVVLMKQVDVHPLSRRPVHVDLLALDLTKKVRVEIEVRLEGKAIGLSEGGLLNAVNRYIEIEVLPTEIPDFIKADVSNLGVGDALHVSDLEMPKGVEVISDASLTIAVVNLIEEEAVATPGADAAAAAPAAAATPAAAAPAAAKAPAAKK